MTPVVARALISSVLLVAAASCRRVERPNTLMISNAATDDSEWSRLVMHATLDTPVGLKISPGVALLGGRANYGGLLPAPGFQRVDSFPVQRRCRRGSMCAVVVRQQLGAVVFAFDPVVEVDLAMPEDGARVSFPRYQDPDSTSAALAMVHEQSAALESVCLDTRLERAQRFSRAQPAEAVLRKTAERARRGVVRRAAELALVQGQCTGAADNRAIAVQLLDTLRPTAPELSLWTDALSMLGSLAQDPGRARTLVDAVIEQHPQPAVGARLLFLRLQGLGDDAHPRAVDELLRRLASPRFAETTAARLAKSFGRVRDAIALRPNDRLPDLEFSGLGGETIRTAEAGAQLQLLYFSASWCGGCIESLPKLRVLARALPDVRIVYVLFDGLNDARQFAAQRAPVPGEIAWTTPDERQALRPGVFTFTMLPSFVLVDADGGVITTSDETELCALADIVARLEGREGATEAALGTTSAEPFSSTATTDSGVGSTSTQLPDNTRAIPAALIGPDQDGHQTRPTLAARSPGVPR